MVTWTLVANGITFMTVRDRFLWSYHGDNRYSTPPEIKIFRNKLRKTWNVGMKLYKHELQQKEYKDAMR